MIRNLNGVITHGCCVLAIAGWTTSSATAKQEKETFRYYYVDADVVSLDAKQSLASYRSEGHVSALKSALILLSNPTVSMLISR
jgi:hypothetical protein